MNRSHIFQLFPVLLLSIMLVLPATVLAESTPDSADNHLQPQSLFDRGNTLLDEGDITGAKQAYRTLIEAGYKEGPVFLNLGYIYTIQDSLGLAVYYYQQAALDEYTVDAAEEGLTYVRQRLPSRETALPKLPWHRAIDWIDQQLGTNGVLFVSLGLVYLTLIVLLLTWFTNVFSKKQGYISSGITLSLAILIAGLSFYIHHLDVQFDKAVLVDERRTVYQNPNTQSAVVSTAFEGYTFTVDYRQSRPDEGWFYIRMSNGMYGWIKTEGVRTYSS